MIMNKDIIIQGWMARDRNNDIFVFKNKPYRSDYEWYGDGLVTLPFNLFPDLTWDSEPQECEIIIKRKKNG